MHLQTSDIFLPTYRVNTIDSITSPPFRIHLTLSKLLLIEALHIKFNKPEINSGLKASKELTLFN